MDEEQQPIADENDQIEQRRRSLDEIIQLGFDPYPHKFERTHSISQLVQQFSSKTGEELDSEKPRARVAGRVHAINKMGKAAFIRFTDGAELLQIYIKSNEVDERTWSLFKLLDLGDFIGTEGRIFCTRTGELSIHAESLTFLSKALVPPPDKLEAKLMQTSGATAAHLEQWIGGLRAEFGGLRAEMNENFVRVRDEIAILNDDTLKTRAGQRELFRRVEELESKAS